MTTLLYLPILVFIGFLLAQLSPTSAQVITLRHPESPRKAPASVPAVPSSPARHEQVLSQKARPGNVIVNFGNNQEIETMQYVMQDGRYATLFQNPLSQQQQVTSNNLQRVTQRSDSSAAQFQPFAPALNQTVEMLNGKLGGVSQIIGERVVIELPDHPVSEHADNGSLSPEMERAVDGKLDVFATVAADAIASGIVNSQAAVPKIRKAGLVLSQLKSKVSSRLRDLPRLVETKLQAKSSAGQAFVDHPHRYAAKGQTTQHELSGVNRLQPLQQTQQYVTAPQPPVKVEPPPLQQAQLQPPIQQFQPPIQELQLTSQQIQQLQPQIQQLQPPIQQPQTPIQQPQTPIQQLQPPIQQPQPPIQQAQPTIQQLQPSIQQLQPPIQQPQPPSQPIQPVAVQQQSQPQPPLQQPSLSQQNQQLPPPEQPSQPSKPPPPEQVQPVAQPVAPSSPPSPPAPPPPSVARVADWASAFGFLGRR